MHAFVSEGLDFDQSLNRLRAAYRSTRMHDVSRLVITNKTSSDQSDLEYQVRDQQSAL